MEKRYENPRPLSPDSQLRPIGICGQCIIGRCKDAECKELLTLDTWQGHNVEWFGFCPYCGQKLPFRK